jgi:CheY-like chemotaxis protein
MGLGLSIVQQLAHGLGGTVDVKSSVGVGTVVEVLAPIRTNTTDVPGSISAQPWAELEPAPYAKYRTQLCGRTVCLISAESYSSLTHQDVAITSEMRQRCKIVEHALRSNVGTGLGMIVVVGTVDHPLPKADIYLVDFDMLGVVVGGHQDDKVSGLLTSRLTPLVLLCSEPGCSQDTRTGSRIVHFTHLHHPLGPTKLATAFCAALKAGPRFPEASDAATEGVPRQLHIPLQREPCQRQKGPGVSTLSNDAPQELAIHPPTSCTSQVTSSTKTYHLLLVDDNPINIILLATVVSKLKHTYVVARNGLEAVQRYQKSLEDQQDRSPFDMVFMDLSMPVMDGFEATRQIRQLEAEGGLRGCKIVSLTGLSSESSRNEAFASGSNVFLTKPVKLNKIKSLLGGELGQQG